MDQGCRLQRRWVARAAVLVFGAGLLLALALTVQAQPRMLDETLPSTENFQPIQVSADFITAWDDGDKQVMLLRGNVVVKQGISTIQTPSAVIWADKARHQTEHVWHVAVYGEGPINLERDAKAQADFGFVRMTTTGEIGIKPFKSVLVKKDLSTDPIYQHALANQPAGRSVFDGPPADPAVRQVAAFQPPPITPLPGPLAPPAPKPIPPTAQPVPKNNDGVPAPNFPPPPLAPGPIVATPLPAPTPAQPKATPRVSIRPRYKGDLQIQYKPVEEGYTAIIVTGGVNVLVVLPSSKPGAPPSSLDIEADRMVIWTKGNAQQMFGNMTSPRGDDSGAHEIYLSGHAELRTRSQKESETLRADEIYYDVRRNVAVARLVDLEMLVPKAANAIHVKTPEMVQLGPKLYQAGQAQMNASTIPSDPGLTVDVSNLQIEEFQRELSYLYGFWPAYDKDGKRIVNTERIFNGRNMVTSIEGVPVFYYPYLKGRVEDPLGPLDSVNAGYNRIFGFQIFTTWDIYDLLDLPHFEGTRWRLNLDYFTERGLGFGSVYDFSGKDLFGIQSKYSGDLKLYGINDRGLDILGANRGQVAHWPDQFTNWPVIQPDFRGIASGKANIQELPDGFSVLGQFAFVSDRNFLEAYYVNTQLNDQPLNTYVQLKQQQNNWAWTLYSEVRTRDWLTETNWLPKLDGYLMGQTFDFGQFEDLFVYNTHAQVGYAQLMPTIQVPFAYLPTDVRTNTMRADWIQDISMPFDLGPFKIAPYLMGDLAYYTADVNGNNQGRVYGGAGTRFSIPFSRLYPDIHSDLFNVNSIYHKISLTGNYYIAQSSTSFNNLPQLTRFNDDATDQALRDIRPLQAQFNPGEATYLTTSPLFNPQYYALRRLVFASPDTLDTINVFQMGLDQRWQTQRGVPGQEHVVDWMTLNIGASVFPDANRDNFGHTFGIVEYNWIWNIGDRTAVTTSGWFEPFAGGPSVFDLGTVQNRTDGSSVYLGYRQIDPVNSKAVVASFIYPFSAKYAVSANTTWDFGNKVSNYSFFVSRMGTDLLVSFGVSYNSTLNTFNFLFEMIPNLARRQSRSAAMFPMAASTSADPFLNQR